MKRAVFLFLFLGLVAQGVSPELMRAGEWPVVEVPSSVQAGEPILGRVTSALPLQSVRVLSGESSLPARINRAGWMYTADFLLSTDQDAPPGFTEIKVECFMEQHMMLREERIVITPRSDPVQRLTLPPSTAEPSKSSMERIEREQKLIRLTLDRVTLPGLWELPFVPPLKGKVSTPFGVRRMINDQPRSPHKGVDFKGRKGDPVAAVNTGRVCMTGEYFFAGKAVFVDHGEGVVSMYFHLSEILVKEGETVPKGGVVGRVGSTGRSTGPHLHFGLSILGRAVDPLPLFTRRQPKG